MRVFRGMKLKHRLLLPNALFVVLVAVAGVLAFSSNRQMQSLRQRAEERARLTAYLEDANEKRDLWLTGGASVDDVKTAHERMAAQIQEIESDVNVDQIWELETQIDTLIKENQKLEQHLYDLTGQSMSISDAYIDMVVKKLADPKEQENVSTMERLVLQGAHANTTRTT